MNETDEAKLDSIVQGLSEAIEAITRLVTDKFQAMCADCPDSQAARAFVSKSLRNFMHKLADELADELAEP